MCRRTPKALRKCICLWWLPGRGHHAPSRQLSHGTVTQCPVTMKSLLSGKRLVALTLQDWNHRPGFKCLFMPGNGRNGPVARAWVGRCLFEGPQNNGMTGRKKDSNTWRIPAAFPSNPKENILPLPTSWKNAHILALPLNQPERLSVSTNELLFQKLKFSSPPSTCNIFSVYSSSLVSFLSSDFLSFLSLLLLLFSLSHVLFATFHFGFSSFPFCCLVCFCLVWELCEIFLLAI